MKITKILFFILIAVVTLIGCAQTNEEAADVINTDTIISISPLGANSDVFEENDLDTIMWIQNLY